MKYIKKFGISQTDTELFMATTGDMILESKNGKQYKLIEDQLGRGVYSINGLSWDEFMAIKRAVKVCGCKGIEDKPMYSVYDKIKQQIEDQ